MKEREETMEYKEKCCLKWLLCAGVIREVLHPILNNTIIQPEVSCSCCPSPDVHRGALKLKSFCFNLTPNQCGIEIPVRTSGAFGWRGGKMQRIQIRAPWYGRAAFPLLSLSAFSISVAFVWLFGLSAVLAPRRFFPHSDDDIFVPAGLDVLPAFQHLWSLADVSPGTHCTVPKPRN